MFASCSTEVAEQVAGQTRDIPQTIVIDFEEGSRVHLENGKTTLDIGDNFFVFNKRNCADTYTYQGNKTDDGNYILDLTNQAWQKENQYIKTDKVLVLHSKGAYNGITMPASKEEGEEEGTFSSVQIITGSTQKYVKGSYAIDSAPMVSVSDDINSISLKNVCGWVKLSIIGNGEIVKKIEFSGNNTEAIATGSFIYNTNLSLQDLSVTSISSASNKITLECNELATLSSTPTDFYFSVLPVEFENGFTVKITCTDGTTMTKTTNKKINIGRNEIQPMTPFEYAGEMIKLDISDLNTPVFRDLTYTEGYADTFEIKVANNSYQNGYFLFYNPDYHAAGNTLNGEYEIAVAEIGDKFDKKIFIADNSRCYVPFEGDEFYFKSGKVTVSGSNATTKIAFNAVVTSKDGTELPLVGECTLNDMGYTKSESNTLTGLGIIGFVYNTSTVTGITTIQGYDKEPSPTTSPTKLITIAMKCNNINNLYGNEFSTSSTTNKITSGSLYLAEGTGVEYPYINGAVTIAQGTLIKSIITFNNMKFIDGAGNIYNIVNPDSGSTSLPLKKGTIQDVGGVW